MVGWYRTVGVLSGRKKNDIIVNYLHCHFHGVYIYIYVSIPLPWMVRVKIWSSHELRSSDRDKSPILQKGACRDPGRLPRPSLEGQGAVSFVARENVGEEHFSH